MCDFKKNTPIFLLFYLCPGRAHLSRPGWAGGWRTLGGKKAGARQGARLRARRLRSGVGFFPAAKREKDQAQGAQAAAEGEGQGQAELRQRSEEKVRPDGDAV